MMNDTLSDFQRFMEQREEAACAYVNGDAEPLTRMAAGDLPATFFSPRGDFVEGANEVSQRYATDAAMFATGNDNTMQILQMAANEEIAYWVGLQRASVHLRGKAEAVPFNLRVTELFRREGTEWKLVHRHADVLKEEESPS